MYGLLNCVFQLCLPRTMSFRIEMNFSSLYLLVEVVVKEIGRRFELGFV